MSKTSNGGYISSTYVRLLFEYLSDHGIDAATLCDESAPDIRHKGSNRYPMQRWQKLLAIAATELNDPELGLHLGQRITPAHLGIVGYVILACSNLGEAMLRLEQYVRLIYDASPLFISQDSDDVVLEWNTELGKPGQLVDATAITVLVQFARNITNDMMQAPSYVSFVNATPDNSAAYRDYFGCEVAFEQVSTIVRIPSKYLTLPLRQPDAALADILSQQATQLLQQLPEANNLEREIRRAISQQLQNGSPSLNNIASSLNISARTLQRRLDDSGSNYKTLLDDTRYRLAKDYLTDERLTIADVAQLLGYSEQSAFSRSFKRWSGIAPKSFQKQPA